MFYWPYDEVEVLRDHSEGFYEFSTPWIKVKIGIEAKHRDRLEKIITKIQTKTLSADDLSEVKWVFTPLNEFSLTYILPNLQSLHSRDTHQILGKNTAEASPRELLRSVFSTEENRGAFLAFEKNLEQSKNMNSLWMNSWSWDVDAAFDFSQGDPSSLFSVARRFHLLDSVENNKTDLLNKTVRDLKKSAKNTEYVFASALVVNQNFYVTKKCDYVLRPALEIAKSSRKKVEEFIKAEAGHDRLLARAMTALGEGSEKAEVSPAAVLLMEFFHYVATKNFLAFCLVVDMFERSSYQEVDPLAKMLQEGGLDAAAKQIEIHREINDGGGHENVALDFLSEMGPIDSSYAKEAMRLAEATTGIMHSLSGLLLDQINVSRSNND